MCTDDDYLGEILVPCVQEALGTDEAETAEILEQNLFHREDMDTDFAEMINSDEIREQPLSKEDAKLLEESEKTAAVRKARAASVTRAIRKLRGGSSMNQQKAGKRKPVNFIPDKSISEEEVRAKLPNDYKVYRDMFNKAWRVYHRSGWSVSRSWGKHGADAPCVRQCLVRAWQRHLLLHPQESCPHDFGE